MTIPLDVVNISTYIRSNLKHRPRKDGSTEFYVNIYGLQARILIRFVEYCWFGRLEMGMDGKPSRYMTRQQELNQRELLEAWLAGDQLGANDFQNECLMQVCRGLAAGKPWMLGGPKLIYEHTQHDSDSPIRRFVDFIFAHGPRDSLFGNAKVGTYPEDFLLKVLVAPTETEESDRGTKKFWLRLANDLGQFAAKEKIDLTQDDETEEDSDMTEVDEIVMTPLGPVRTQRPAHSRPAQPRVVMPQQSSVHPAAAPPTEGKDVTHSNGHKAPAPRDGPTQPTAKRSRNAHNTMPDRSVRQFSVEVPKIVGSNFTDSSRNQADGNRCTASKRPAQERKDGHTPTATRTQFLFHEDTPASSLGRRTPLPSIPDSVIGAGDDDDDDDDEYVNFDDKALHPSSSDSRVISEEL